MNRESAGLVGRCGAAVTPHLPEEGRLKDRRCADGGCCPLFPNPSCEAESSALSRNRWAGGRAPCCVLGTCGPIAALRGPEPAPLGGDDGRALTELADVQGALQHRGLAVPQGDAQHRVSRRVQQAAGRAAASQHVAATLAAVDTLAAVRVLGEPAGGKRATAEPRALCTVTPRPHAPAATLPTHDGETRPHTSGPSVQGSEPQNVPEAVRAP